MQEEEGEEEEEQELRGTVAAVVVVVVVVVVVLDATEEEPVFALVPVTNVRLRTRHHTTITEKSARWLSCRGIGRTATIFMCVRVCVYVRVCACMCVNGWKRAAVIFSVCVRDPPKTLSDDLFSTGTPEKNVVFQD